MDTFTTKSQELNTDTTRTNRGMGDNVSLESDIEVPFSQYEKVYGRTYSEKYFGKEASEIESFILNQIELRNLIDSTDTYEKLIEEIFGKLGVDENETLESKFNKVIGFINMSNRKIDREEKLKRLTERKEKLEQERKEKKLQLYKEELKEKEIKEKEIKERNSSLQNKIKQLEREKMLLQEQQEREKENFMAEKKKILQQQVFNNIIHNLSK
jgi:hypothetical protein